MAKTVVGALELRGQTMRVILIVNRHGKGPLGVMSIPKRGVRTRRSPKRRRIITGVFWRAKLPQTQVRAPRKKKSTLVTFAHALLTNLGRAPRNANQCSVALLH